MWDVQAARHGGLGPLFSYICFHFLRALVSHIIRSDRNPCTTTICVAGVIEEEAAHPDDNDTFSLLDQLSLMIQVGE
jgi:hypothetical protein